MMADAKEVEEFVGSLMSSLKSRDFLRSEITDMRVSQMSDNTAFVASAGFAIKPTGRNWGDLVKRTLCKTSMVPGKL